MSRRAELTDKSRAFCYNYAYLSEGLARAYIHAGYKTTVNSSQEAEKLLKKPYVQDEIRRLKNIKAREIIQANADKTAEIIVTREKQALKLEKIQVMALEYKIPDLTNAIAAIREQNAIYGLRLDVLADGSGKLDEIDDKLRLAASSIPDSLLLESPQSPKLVANTEISASQDGAGLTGTSEAEQLRPLNEAQEKSPDSEKLPGLSEGE